MRKKFLSELDKLERKYKDAYGNPVREGFYINEDGELIYMCVFPGVTSDDGWGWDGDRTIYSPYTFRKCKPVGIRKMENHLKILVRKGFYSRAAWVAEHLAMTGADKLRKLEIEDKADEKNLVAKIFNHR